MHFQFDKMKQHFHTEIYPARNQIGFLKPEKRNEPDREEWSEEAEKYHMIDY